MRLAEYIWLDGTEPTPMMRSKTKVLDPEEQPPTWGFDGSSTKQAEGDSSDCVLKPTTIVRDPFRGGENILVLCEVWTTDNKPHRTNTRHACRVAADQYINDDVWFGMEQEYTLMKNDKPLGFPTEGEPNPQGDYYCGAGTTRAFGRQIAEQHLAACLYAGLRISGINAEVCPGQWEYQVGPLDAVNVSDQVWLARYIMERVTEQYNVQVSWDGKPMEGDWNGAGCHTNFSTEEMRSSYAACVNAAEALGNNVEEHIENYGSGIKNRLTGQHETCSHEEFKYGVSDRTASIRIPWQVARDQRGYIEDRRPNANCDPYKVTRLITTTVCGNK
jgi:glutamine synthetase